MEYTTQTFVYPNCTVRVHTPVLTEEERARRHEELERAAERFLKHVEMVEATKRNCNQEKVQDGQCLHEDMKIAE
mgnify:CR=1 FL=1